MNTQIDAYPFGPDMLPVSDWSHESLLEFFDPRSIPGDENNGHYANAQAIFPPQERTPHAGHIPPTTTAYPALNVTDIPDRLQTTNGLVQPPQIQVPDQSSRYANTQLAQSSETTRKTGNEMQEKRLELYKTKRLRRGLRLKELGISPEQDDDYLHWHELVLGLELELDFRDQQEVRSVLRDANIDSGNGKTPQSPLNTLLAIPTPSSGAYVPDYRLDNFLGVVGVSLRWT
jgi:hypothetical protein